MIDDPTIAPKSPNLAAIPPLVRTHSSSCSDSLDSSMIRRHSQRLQRWDSSMFKQAAALGKAEDGPNTAVAQPSLPFVILSSEGAGSQVRPIARVGGATANDRTGAFGV